MSDLEGLVRKLISKGLNKKEIKRNLVHEIQFYKDELGFKPASNFAEAIIQEVINSKILPKTDFVNYLLQYVKSNVKMGVMGVGSRGEGDFFVHRLLANIASSFNSSNILLNPICHDDAGAVKIKDNIIIAAVDGIHSRLSEFPFLAGFHATRASLRDVYVKGGKPIGLFVDIHLADDGDIGKLFDFEAGISTISKLSETPVLTGSTLRIGGDMVIGDRLSGCVGTIGVLENESMLTARYKVKPKSVILMTEGAGGGTICTSAIYSGRPEIVLETLNVKFIKACKALFDSNLLEKIDAMTDVTNGGLRGDAFEISKISDLAIYLDECKIKGLVNKSVFKLLEENEIDYFGVSLDSLLIFTSEDYAKEIIRQIRKVGVKISIIGWVERGPSKVALVNHNGVKDLTQKFRESAYTKIKKVVGEEAPHDLNELKSKVNDAAEKSIEKRDRIIRYLLDK